ncbi:hypothetical protein S7335_1248 [Synechococcus sp. PCC 7335]|nr:hypothetical protein S7335_1248 [Synechococcus sp. PCC 7335]
MVPEEEPNCTKLVEAWLSLVVWHFGLIFFDRAIETVGVV